MSGCPAGTPPAPTGSPSVDEEMELAVVAGAVCTTFNNAKDEDAATPDRLELFIGVGARTLIIRTWSRLLPTESRVRR